MYPTTSKSSTRRTVLRTLSIGTTALLGTATLSGTASAWERNDIDFKGCSEVWIIVAPADIDPDIYDPPTVAHVVVETDDGTLDCRLQEFTPETTTTIPGQYGDAPVLKYAPPSGEKVLGVVIYNYASSTDRFERNSPLTLNPNRCANTPETPDPTEASCAANTYLSTEDIVDDPGRGRGTEGDRSNGSDSPDNTSARGPPDHANGSSNGRPDQHRGRNGTPGR